MKNKIIFSLFVMIIACYSVLYYIDTLKHKDINDYLLVKIESLRVAKNAILDTFYSVNKKYYYDIMHNEKVLKILKEFKYADKQKQNLLRGRLYRLLYKEYELQKELNVNQFHFHTHDGRSLLRFHVPYINDDMLLGVRNTIKSVIKSKKPSI